MTDDRVDSGPEGSALQLVVFDLEGQRYALPLSAVDKVLPMVAVSPLPQAPTIALGVINLHGQVLPVLDLRHRFGFPPRDYGIDSYLLVARTSRRTLAVPVDGVVGVVEVRADLIVSPDAVLPGIANLAGIVALPDGLLFIHDLETFLSLEEEERLTEVLSPPPSRPTFEGKGKGGGPLKAEGGEQTAPEADE